jgi:AraC-like DNA-binding protein
LDEEKTSYRKLADELRAEMAIKYLRETDLHVDEVAAALGFNEAANFRQAFRRWTKATPSKFRNIRPPPAATSDPDGPKRDRQRKGAGARLPADAQ